VFDWNFVIMNLSSKKQRGDYIKKDQLK